VGSTDKSKKKKTSKDDSSSRTNESLTIPQREQRALEQLGNYFEDCGGEFVYLTDGEIRVNANAIMYFVAYSRKMPFHPLFGTIFR
jgi:hypothetical protein